MNSNVSKMSCKRAFTLIELLVVVLIIGVLSAVAVPQYQRAVAKSEAVEGLALLKHLVIKAELYKLEHGEYPPTLDALDPELSGEWTGTKVIYYKGQSAGARSNENLSITLQNGPVLNSQGGVHGIHVGLIKGPYQGAGFSYLFNRYIAAPSREIVCSEFKGHSDAPFQKNKGDFCEKLFQAKKSSYDLFNNGYDVYYHMPY